MAQRHVQWLREELPRLVSEGVIAQETADRIAAHYGEPAESPRHGLMLAIAGVLGVTLIGLGVILLIGHNWDQLGRDIRAGLSFAPLVLAQIVLLYAFFRRRDSMAWMEGAAVLVTAGVAASIALISQTYQIQGDLQAYLVVCALLVLPLPYLTRTVLPALIYMAAAVAVLIAWRGVADPGYWFWPLFALILPYFVWMRRSMPSATRVCWLGWGVAIALTVGVLVGLERLVPGLWIPIGAGLAACAILFDRRLSPVDGRGLGRPFAAAGWAGLVGIAVALTFPDVWRDVGWLHMRTPSRFYPEPPIAEHVILGAVLLLTLAGLFAALRRREGLCLLAGLLPFLGLAGVAIVGRVPQAELILSAGANVYVLALGVALAAAGVARPSVGVMNAGLLLLAALIAIRFFDQQIDFMIRGAAFVAVGVVFLIANAVVAARKRRLYEGAGMGTSPHGTPPSPVESPAFDEAEDLGPAEDRPLFKEAPPDLEESPEEAAPEAAEPAGETEEPRRDATDPFGDTFDTPTPRDYDPGREPWDLEAPEKDDEEDKDGPGTEPR